MHTCSRSAGFVLLTLLAFSLFTCRKQSSEEENKSGQRAVVAVRIAPITSGEATLMVVAFGRTDALRKEKVYAPSPGRIVSLKAFEGTWMKKGETMAQIQTKESQAALLGAESMLESAGTPEQRKEAEHLLRLARTSQNVVPVIAKFDGFVSTRNVSEGELVAENAELLTFIDLSTVNFLADVPLQDIPAVKQGQRALIRFQTAPDSPYSAVVEAMNPQTDIQSQTVKVRIQFLPTSEARRSMLRTDMFGSASIVTGVRAHALFIPKSGLLRNDEDNSYSIMTLTLDSLAMRVPVSVSTLSDSTAEIQSSLLHQGMPVITEGNYSLTDSTRVSVLPSGRE